MKLSEAEASRISALSPGALDQELIGAGFKAFVVTEPHYEPPDVKLEIATRPDDGSHAAAILLEVRSEARKKFLVYLAEIGRIAQY